MSKLNVAIADDNERMLRLLGEIVSSDEELQVVGTAKDGEEAYKMIRDKEPDVVLLDIVMPKLDGLGVLSVYLDKLNMVSDISNLRDLEVNSIMSIKGIGKVKAIELIAAIELGKRVYLDKKIEEVKIKGSADVYNYFNTTLKDKKQEHFYVLYLDNKKKVISKKLLYVGTINGSTAHPREIFKYAYLVSASFIICVHNHPSGDPQPSKEDALFTNKLIEIGKLNNIPILDHIIIGKNCYFSFFEEG